MSERFLAFVGRDYYPSGGWTDFVFSSDTLAEAEPELLKAMQGAIDEPPGTPNRPTAWGHIVDLAFTRKVVVASSDRDWIIFERFAPTGLPLNIERFAA